MLSRSSRIGAGALTLVVLVMTFISAQADEKRCFDPLTDPASQNPKDWEKLIKWKPTDIVAKNPNVEFLQDAKDHGTGAKINLDYYAVTFDADKSKSMPEFFSGLRKDFSSLLFKKTDAGSFNPYPRVDVDPKLAKENEGKWQSADPTGALMNFILDSIHINLLLTEKVLKTSISEGDVFVTCSTPTDFIFSVVATKETGTHPVSGNRGFGIKDEGNGHWTFYTMAADRQSTNWKAYVYSRSHLDLDIIYKEGDKVWVGMLENFAIKYKNLHPQSPPVHNTKRYDYPSCCNF